MNNSKMKIGNGFCPNLPRRMFLGKSHPRRLPPPNMRPNRTHPFLRHKPLARSICNWIRENTLPPKRNDNHASWPTNEPRQLQRLRKNENSGNNKMRPSPYPPNAPKRTTHRQRTTVKTFHHHRQQLSIWNDSKPISKSDPVRKRGAIFQTL